MLSKLSLAATALLSGASAEEHPGLSFVVIGDFAEMYDLEMAKHVFNSMDKMKKEAEPNSPEDFSFFLTVGDNLYPYKKGHPSQFEFDRMLNLWRDRKHIKDIPVYPVRGNHDCMYIDENAELKLKKKMDTWDFEKYYFQREFEIGANGEKFSILGVDSCFLMCSTINKNKEKYYSKMDPDSLEVYDQHCGPYADFTEQGNEMLKWMTETLDEQAKDDKVKWKVSAMHHPMFGTHYNDNWNIIDHFLPIAKKYEFDVYLNGHEHTMNYARVPKNITEPEFEKSYKKDDACHRWIEWFPQDGPEKESRTIRVKKGEHLHQMTIGNSGNFLYDICYDHHTVGDFLYTQNKLHGFALVTATPELLKVVYKGVDRLSNGTVDLLTIEIENDE